MVLAQTIEVSLVVFVQRDVQAVVVKVALVEKNVKKNFLLYFSSQTIFAYCIHVQIVVNVFPKAVVDVVFARLHITVMIVEMVNTVHFLKKKLVFDLLFQFIDLIHAIIFIVVMDNVVKVFVNVMEVIADHSVMLHVSWFLIQKEIDDLIFDFS